MLSFNSYSEWTKVDADSEKTVYVDISTIINKDEHIYWWSMVDSKLLNVSYKLYTQGDCLISRSKLLTKIFYSESMGLGDSNTITPDNPLWEYHPPDNWNGILLRNVCKLSNASPDEKQEILNEINLLEELQKISEIEEIEALAKIAIALELDLKLLDLQILTQEKQQEIDSLEKIRKTYQKDELLISLNELRAEIEEAKVEIEQLKVEKKLKDEALIAEGNLILENLRNSIRQSYVNSIAAKVRHNWFWLGAEDGWTAEVNVLQDRNGRVLSVNTSNPSAENSNYELIKSFTDSIKRAVFKSSPLPYTTDDSVFESNINFIFYAN